MRNLSGRRRPSKAVLTIVADPRRELIIRKSGLPICEACDILATADEALYESNPDTGSASALPKIILRARSLGTRLKEWSSGVSGRYKYRKLEPLGSLVSNTPIYSQTKSATLLYSSPSMAVLWNIHRITRIYLLHYLVRCTSRKFDLGAPIPLSPQIIGPELSAANEISGLIDDTCASVPYLLGEISQEGNLQRSSPNKAVGGFFLLWPLPDVLFLGRADQTKDMDRETIELHQKRLWDTKSHILPLMTFVRHSSNHNAPMPSQRQQTLTHDCTLHINIDNFAVISRLAALYI